MKLVKISGELAFTLENASDYYFRHEAKENKQPDSNHYRYPGNIVEVPVLGPPSFFRLEGCLTQTQFQLRSELKIFKTEILNAENPF